MFTLENSINEILADGFVKEHLGFLFPSDFIDLVPNDMRNVSAKELSEKLMMPWGIPYLSKELVDSANMINEFVDSSDYEFVQLWKESTDANYFPVSDGSKDSVCVLKFKNSFKDNRPMALIVPGGAYMSVAIGNEGMFTAKALEEAGYAVAILNYRCMPNYYPEPQKDLALASKYMRYLATVEEVKDDLLVLGYSAGGHLVASTNCYPEEIDEVLVADLADNHKEVYEMLKEFPVKADKVCLSYPVIDFMSEQHEQSFECLTGKDESLRDKLSIDLHVTPEYPKTFVWACDDDSLVPPSNAKRMYNALRTAGVEAMHRAYPTGEHGCATAVGTSAEGWVDEMVGFMK